MIICETERLIIRLQSPSDALSLMELNSDPDVVRYTGDGTMGSASEALKIIEEKVIPQWTRYRMGRFAVTTRDGEYLGWCGLRYFPENGDTDLGYRFMKKHWGKGYATESSRGVLDYGFKVLRLPRIIARAMPENTDSIKVMQKLGMTFRGHRSDPADPHCSILYDIKSSEWKG